MVKNFSQRINSSSHHWKCFGKKCESWLVSRKSKIILLHLDVCIVLLAIAVNWRKISHSLKFSVRVSAWSKSSVHFNILHYVIWCHDIWHMTSWHMTSLCHDINAMTYKIITYDIIKYDFMTYGVMTYDIMALLMTSYVMM